VVMEIVPVLGTTAVLGYLVRDYLVGEMRGRGCTRLLGYLLLGYLLLGYLLLGYLLLGYWGLNPGTDEGRIPAAWLAHLRVSKIVFVSPLLKEIGIALARSRSRLAGFAQSNSSSCSSATAR